MKGLRLISRLQPSEMVTLCLEQQAGERLQYFIISNSINYGVITMGTCEGDIGGGRKTFNILMSSVYQLVEKGYDLQIRYKDDTLEFMNPEGNLSLRPLCVEYYDERTDGMIAKLIRYQKLRESDTGLDGRIARIEQEIREAQDHYDGLQKMQLEGAITSSNPFGELSESKVQETLETVIKEKREELSEVQKQARALQTVDMKPFRVIATAAARAHEMISFCDDYAIVALKSSFLLQKGKCPAMTVQGPLLQQLLRYSNGEGFSWFENGLVYSVGEKTGEVTAVFLEKYLPNTTVDSSIVTRGVVSEKQTLRMKGVLKVTQLLKSKFPEMVLDLGEGQLLMSNSKGEQVVSHYEVEDVDNPAVRRMRREGTLTGAVESYRINIPSEVQSLLSLFRDKMIVYVKAKKVVLQAEDFYVVFGR